MDYCWWNPVVIRRNFKLGLLFLAVFLLGILLRGYAQQAPLAKPKQSVQMAAEKPDISKYSNWEAYQDDLINWSIAHHNGSFAVTSIDNQVGRYQIFFRANVRADTFLVDTVTGKTWTPIEYTNVKGQPTVWRVQERLDSPLEVSQWESRQETK